MKIVQRMVAADDREVIGETINLDDKQKKFITILQTGDAIAYSEGLHKSFLIKIPNYKAKLPSARTSNQIVSDWMQNYYYSNPDLLLRFDNCLTCKERRKNCEKIYIEDEKIISEKPFKEAFSRLITSFVHNKTLVITTYQDILFLIRQLSKVVTKEEESNLVYCALTCYVDYTFESRGKFHKWEFQKVENLIEVFNKIIQKLVSGYGITETKKLEAELSPYITKFSNDYIQLCSRERLHYISCKLCKNRCLFQYEIKTILREYKYLSESFEEAFFRKQLEDVAKVCIRAAKLVVNRENEVALRQAALCFAAHKYADIGLTTSNQEMLSNDIYAIINSMDLSFSLTIGV